MNEYVKATGLSKSEALRRLLRDALQQQKRRQNRLNFEAVARRIIEKNRALNMAPISKEEIDNIFE